jgi:acetyl-CoA acetyltransferase
MTTPPTPVSIPIVSIHGIGFARCPSPEAISLTELVFEASRAALTDAGLERADIDGVCLAASDQLDGRAISSMQLAGPAGGYLKDEIKVGDDGSLAFAMAVLRIEAGADRKVLAVSWTKESESPLEMALGVNAEPVFTRPAGLHPLVAEAALTASFLDRAGLPAPDGGAEEFFCWPLRHSDLPGTTDAAVALVVCEGPGPVEVAGLSWATEVPDPTARRLTPEAAVAAVAGRASAEAGVVIDGSMVIETTDRTPYRLAMTLAGLGLTAGANVNPSGGLTASNPVYAAGLERVAHAALAVRNGAPLAVAHSSYGYAGQGQFLTILRAGIVAGASVSLEGESR